MSNTKTVMGQAANTQGIPLDITDVFSTYLYDGTNVAQTITNGIDLAGEGGLVWQKLRTHPTPPDGQDHYLRDTERGGGYRLNSNTTNAQFGDDGGITAFNSNGFSLSGGTAGNLNGATYASWTFRKAPKFFDVVTYTGDGTTDGSKKVLHNLGSAPGCIIVKRTDSTGEWNVYHRGITSSPETRALYLNQTSAYGTGGAWGSTLPTDTEFTVGSSATVNISNATYVAYVFAHNDGDGEFGPDADQDIIKCGSYTGNGSGTAGPEIDLGFEPQWILAKRTDSTGYWTLVDSMRGMIAGGDDKILYPNTSDAEQQSERFVPSATGFQVNSTNGYVNASGGSYIYMAIRRGPLAQPKSGTEVFDVSTRNASEPAYTSGFPVDFAFARAKNIANNWDTGSRLQQGNRMFTNLTNAEATNSNMMFDYQEGWSAGTGASTDYLSWMWKRAPGFFDVVAYTGNGTAGHTVSHNLGVAPELIIVKNRTYNGSNWIVWCDQLTRVTEEPFMILNATNGKLENNAYWNNGAHTNSVFETGSNLSVNGSGYSHIAYLFATVPGVSKVFSVTKSSGSDASVDCGFTSGPRFVMLKRTDSTGDWYVWDTERGIVAGNDPYLLLNSTAAEVTSTDYIDPTSNGFTIVNGGLADGDYIGYAVS